jgi:hypothetical protein
LQHFERGGVAHLRLPALAQVVVDGPHRGGPCCSRARVQDFQFGVRRFGGAVLCSC